MDIFKKNPFQALLRLLMGVLLSTPLAAANQHAVILQYHHVSDDTPASTSVTPEQFAKHLDWLKENDFKVLPLPQIIETLRANRHFGHDRVVAITFDDAGNSVCDIAWPMLKQRKLPFTLFINSQPVDDQYPSHCSWQQLRTMTQSGLMTPANHTHRHLHMLDTEYPLGSNDWRALMREEISQTGQRIKQQLGVNSTLFAYPFGEYNRQLTRLVNDMGYVGFGQQSGAIGPHSDFSALPRFPASGQFARLDTLSVKLLSLPLPFKVEPVHDNPIAQNGRTNPPLLRISAESADQLAGINCFNAMGEPLPTSTDNTTLRVQAGARLAEGRHRYTCTQPSKHAKRFYWTSHQWLVK